MHKLDVRISKRIQAFEKSRMWLWSRVASYGLYSYAVVVSGVLYFINGKSRVIFMLIPVLATMIITAIVQIVIRRKRPVVTKTHYDPFISTFSFPSMHASISFAFATALSIAFINSWLAFGWLYALIFFLIAICITASRIIVGVHYFGDALAGALLGMVVSIALIGV